MDSICKRLQIALRARGMKQVDLVNLTGIGKSSISTYLAGEYEPKQKNLYKLAKALDVSESWLMGYDVPMDRNPSLPDNIPENVIKIEKFQKVPLLGQIACGTPILAEENIEDYIDAPGHIRADYALTCKGDSMINAGIKDGDIVYIRKQEVVENGQIAAVMVGDDEATLKRFYVENGVVTLNAENPAYSPKVFVGEEAAQIHVIGLAVAFLHHMV